MTVRIGIDKAARYRQLSDAINAERDRRIEARFTFRGRRFDFDEASKMRITGAATLAGFAIGAGAQPGDYRWNGGAVGFTWLSRDNVAVPLDAPTMFAMGQAAAEHERAHIFAARAIKDMAPVPDGFADDKYWPQTA
ncbi:MAG: hypothetical protein ACI8R4_003953 [Paracoccaceae bacterium]|jgi:hypothetical protein